MFTQKTNLSFQIMKTIFFCLFSFLMILAAVSTCNIMLQAVFTGISFVGLFGILYFGHKEFGWL